MRLLATLVILTMLALPAMAKPFTHNDVPNRVACDFTDPCFELDLSGFDGMACDDTGGLPVWEYGPAVGIATVDCYGNAVTDVLGTVLAGDYFADSGDRAVIYPAFMVTPACNMLEICHYVEMENSYDGGNVQISTDGGASWIVISPMGGYLDDEISDSTSYYAFCVDGQPGFTDDLVLAFVQDCFDLTEFMDMEILVSFVFGSDSSVQYPGWYVDSAIVGGMATAAQDSDWSTLRTLY